MEGMSGTLPLRHRDAPDGVQRAGDAEDPPLYLGNGPLRADQAWPQKGSDASVPICYRQPGGYAEGVVLVGRAAVPRKAGTLGNL